MKKASLLLIKDNRYHILSHIGNGMKKKSMLFIIGITTLGIGSYVFFSWEQHTEEVVPYITQSIETDTPSCAQARDFPTVVWADKAPIAFLPVAEKYTLLAFCSPLAQGCIDLIHATRMGDIKQRQAQGTCNFHTLIPYSQRSSWLKTTITLQPYFATSSAGVEVVDREKLNTILQITNDVVPLFLLLDTCGAIVAQTSNINEIIPLFSPYCWAITQPICGDGTLDDGEVCDDGNIEEDDACTALCKPTTCWDEVINTPNAEWIVEQCDDGNSIADDGCSATCQLEKEHIRYCDADDDSFYSFYPLPINTRLSPHLVVQPWTEEQFAYCTKEQWCRYVSCRHTPGDDCNDTNDQEYTAGSYCTLATSHGTFDEACLCTLAPQFQTQSLQLQETAPLPQTQWWCGSPDGKFINYPWAKEIAGTSSLRYQCSINNCSYCTDEACFPKWGVCYYFCQEDGKEIYTTPCGNGLATDIAWLSTCAWTATCGVRK
jgi:cysteine-rich repeat protein